MSIFILIFLIDPLPAPTYMFLDTYDNLKDCQAAIAAHKYEEHRDRMACIQIVSTKVKGA
jgi:hypothetical protein